MSKMRAKMRVTSVQAFRNESDVVVQENLQFNAVGPNTSYPEDGSDENNTYARFTPVASMNITVMNPALLGLYQVGQEYYVDFTPVPQQS